jgi:hypothetical protein
VIPCANSGSQPWTAESCQSVGGTPVGGGAVCDYSNGCEPPPGTPGPCCETGGSCAALDDHTCTFWYGGTWYPSAVCSPSGACVQ